MKPNPLIVAIDRSAPEDIEALVRNVGDVASHVKIGLQAFVSNGPQLVRRTIEAGSRVFLDLKVHDIPNTARHAVAEASALGASIVTVHASGGPEMLRAAADAAGGAMVAAVTILTSLDAVSLQRIGFSTDPATAVLRLAELALENGVRGIVASPLEIELLRKELGRDPVIITPGIRSESHEPGDQRRTMTPRSAIDAGADFIVVGRPITSANDPRAAAEEILAQCRKS